MEGGQSKYKGPEVGSGARTDWVSGREIQPEIKLEKYVGGDHIEPSIH